MIAEKVFDEPLVYRIQVPYPNIALKETNVYVIRDGDDTLIVDMGAPTDDAVSVFMNALAELGVELEDASYFFTHMHFDHSGMVDRVLPDDALIYLNALEHKAATPSFVKDMGDYVDRRFLEEGMDVLAAKEKSAVVDIATAIDNGQRNICVVSDGDDISVGRFSFKVIDLPGHTRGMMGLYHLESGIFFSGDQLLFIISTANGLFLDGTDSVAAYLQSMEKLLALDISKLFHSHGDIRDDFRERGLRILHARKSRLDQVISIVRDHVDRGICPTGIEVVKEISWKIPFDSIDDCELRQQWLIYTQGISFLDHLVAEGRLERVRSERVGLEQVTPEFSERDQISLDRIGSDHFDRGGADPISLELMEPLSYVHRYRV